MPVTGLFHAFKGAVTLLVVSVASNRKMRWVEPTQLHGQTLTSMFQNLQHRIALDDSYFLEKLSCLSREV